MFIPAWRISTSILDLLACVDMSEFYVYFPLCNSFLN